MTDEEKKIQELKDLMFKQRGYRLAQWEYVADRDVNFMEAYNNLYASGLADGKALPAKTRELIAIALLAYRGLNDDVYNHAKRALKLGATKQEILEAVETSIIPGGAPTFSSGLKALMRVEEEDK
jgi:AhpD family alkylhydroperoxidase